MRGSEISLKNLLVFFNISREDNDDTAGKTCSNAGAVQHWSKQFVHETRWTNKQHWREAEFALRRFSSTLTYNFGVPSSFFLKCLFLINVHISAQLDGYCGLFTFSIFLDLGQILGCASFARGAASKSCILSTCPLFIFFSYASLIIYKKFEKSCRICQNLEEFPNLEEFDRYNSFAQTGNHFQFCS